MKYFLYFLFFLIIFAVNEALFQVFGIRIFVPSLVFIALLAFALERDNFEFFFWATLVGLWLDFSSAAFVGTYSFALLLTAYVLNLIVSELALEVKWRLLVGVLVGALALTYATAWLYVRLVTKLGWALAYQSFRFSWHGFFLELVVDLILFYPGFILVEWMKQFSERLLSKHPLIK